jgi:hypothetical protein
MSGRKLLFPFQIPQKNFDAIQATVLVCDKCLNDISELKFESEDYHPRMEMEDIDDRFEEHDEYLKQDMFQIQIDYCALCGEDYMVTVEEHLNRTDKATISAHTCDSCLMVNGHEDQPYYQIKTCDSCLEEVPYDLSLTGYIKDSFPREECPNCCMGDSEKEDKEVPEYHSDLPFPENYKNLEKDIRNSKPEEVNDHFVCEEFGEYYFQLWRYTNIGYVIYSPPEREVKCLTFSIFIVSEEIIKDRRLHIECFGKENCQKSLSHTFIEQSLFMFDENHVKEFSTNWEGQIACLQAALLQAEKCFYSLNGDKGLSPPI